MKLIITGDWHLDAVTAGQVRIEEAQRAVQQIIDRAEEQRVDAVVFLGDLCNPYRGSRTLRSVTAGVELFKSLVSRAGCSAVLVAGNHDVVHDDSGLTSLSPVRAAFGQDALGPTG